MTDASTGRDQICVFCGVNAATTRDHVPPRGIFTRPYPNDLVTVPACVPCNNSASPMDEEFRAMLSLRVGTPTPEARKLWKDKTLKGIRRNKRLLRQIIEKTQDVWIKNSSGLILEKRLAFLWDAKVHDDTIIRITRGLFFHHFREILLPSIRIKPHYYSHIDENLYNVYKACPKYSIGGNQFVYSVGRAEELPNVTVWLYQFHEGHWAGAITAEADLQEPRISAPAKTSPA